MARHSVGPCLGPICLQRLSADIKVPTGGRVNLKRKLKIMIVIILACPGMLEIIICEWGLASFIKYYSSKPSDWPT